MILRRAKETINTSKQPINSHGSSHVHLWVARLRKVPEALLVLPEAGYLKVWI